MRIINALMASWKTKTTAEKIKTVLHGIAMIGGGAIGGTIGDKCSAGRKPVEAICAKLTAAALGGAVTGVAVKQMDETVDTINALIQKRKEEGGSANA